MIVISDTSPLCYLILIGQDQILSRLFGTITIPYGVRNELQHEEAPDAVRNWMVYPPDWLIIREVSGREDRDLSFLHSGEREAIQLAQTLQADLVLLDEKAARQAAGVRNLTFTGLLGLLSRAAAEGLLDLPDTIRDLRSTTFRASPGLLKQILDRHQAKA